MQASRQWLGNRTMIFLISQTKHVVGTQKNRVIESSLEHQKHGQKVMGKKIFTILRWKFLFT